MSQQNKNIDEDLSNNEKEQGPVDAKNHNSSDATAEYDATFQPTEDKVSNCEERLEKSVATATKKSEEAVNQVEKELKKEKAFNNFNGWLSIVTFGLLILVVLGDYIYESSSNARNKTRLSDIRSNVIRLEDRVQSLYDADKVTSITLQNTVNHAQDVEDKLHELEKQFAGAKALLDEVKVQKKADQESKKEVKIIKVGEDPEKLLRNEALYLLKLSYRKMYLEHDVQTAISLLKEADVALADLQDPQLIQIRKAISSDIRNLSNLELVDSESLVIRLSALEENVKNLPILGYKLNFSSVAEENENHEQVVNENIGDWKENLSNGLSNFFGKLVIVRKNTDKELKFLSKDEIVLLQNRLTISLLEAQMAVYSQQQIAYELNLRKVSDLITRYYDCEDPSTEQVLNEIKELQSSSVIFIGVQQFESLNLLRDYMKNIK
ncbi:MAG: uroporphyrinogen-III C-methyltransferase [Succinivibrionaceae bacterium]